MDQRLWIVDDAIAYVDNGAVTLQIDKPTRHLPRRMAFEVADRIWFAGQMRELEIARKRGETKEIPLTDRRRRSSLRLGGGFMITQGTKLVVVRRTLDAPRPGQFCECGGVFEFTPQDPKDPEDVRNDYIASLLRESQEIVLIQGSSLYIPQLAPSPFGQIGFQPPGTLDSYNCIIEDEVEEQIKGAHIPVTLENIKRFWIKILDYEQSVRLQFGYSPEVSVEITAEIDTSSLECVGVLSFPENIDNAVIAFLEEELLELKRDADKNAARIREVKLELDKAQKERAEGGEVQYWDAELDGEDRPVDRDIHLIDIETGEDTVWFVPKDAKGRRREYRKSTLWEELSATKLGPLDKMGTGGRFATEKLEKAIKMHCPFPRLQPLVRL